MTDFAALRPKIYSYLTGNNDENKKAKDTKKCVRKWKIKLEDYKHCLEVTQLESTKYKIKVMWIVLKKIIKNSQNNNKLLL